MPGIMPDETEVETMDYISEVMIMPMDRARRDVQFTDRGDANASVVLQ